MISQDEAKRLTEKTPLHTLQVELQAGYDLSPVEAQVLAHRVQQLVDEQLGTGRQPGQIMYQAIAMEEPPGKPLNQCRKVPVRLTLVSDEDGVVWATQGPKVLRRVRVHRLVYEALIQGGALSQEDLACILGVSRKTVQRLFAYFREQDERLPSRGEIQDMGRGVSHKIPVIRKYVQDMSFSSISLALRKHGIDSMVRYLRHFALVMILDDRGLSPEQMQSVIGISQNLIEEYRALYTELNVPQYARTLERLKQTVFSPATATTTTPEQPNSGLEEAQKGGPR
jgi:hypothetical protein